MADILDQMDEQDVVEVQLNQYSNHILKSFSDTLRAHESSDNYRIVELALIDAYERLTGVKISKGEL